MSAIKTLAGQTAIYGMSSILGRLLNYILVPLHVTFFAPAEYGVVSEFYAYVTFFTVLLSFGLETTYFRFVNKSDDPDQTFNRIFSLLLIINGSFLVLGLIFSQAIANALYYPHLQNVVVWFVFILVVDATTSLFLARLRQENKAKKFALVNIASIATNVILNLIFIWYGKSQVDAGNTEGLAAMLYSPEIGIGYIFIANLAGSLIKPILLYKELGLFKFDFSKSEAKLFFLFALPIAIAGFAGMINEAIDRILIKYIVFHQTDNLEAANTQVGIYSANYKLSIIITLFIQAFRFAAEPFFFAQEKNADKSKVYSKVMTWFVIVVALIFISVSLTLDIFKWFMPNSSYWEGLHVVPVLLLANVFLGIYYNQSIWYKLADKPKFGAFIAIGGAILTLILNIVLIPVFGYTGSAWATLAVYAAMCVASWRLGQKHYPIKYNLRKVLLFLSASILLTLLGLLIQGDNVIFNITVAILLIGVFISLVLFIERPLRQFRKT